MEWVKEAVSSEGPQRQGPTHTYRDSSERSRSVPMQITPRKCGIVPDQHICVVGFKVLRDFYVNCGESVQPLQSVKLIYQPCSRSRAAWTLT